MEPSSYQKFFREKYPKGVLHEYRVGKGAPNIFPDPGRPMYDWTGSEFKRTESAVVVPHKVFNNAPPFALAPREFYLMARHELPFAEGMSAEVIEEHRKLSYEATKEELLNQYDALIQKMIDQFGPEMFIVQGVRRELEEEVYSCSTLLRNTRGFFYESILSLSCIVY